MKSEMAVRRHGPLWPWLLVIGLCVLCDTRCTSRQLTKPIAEQKAENAKVKEEVKASNLDPKTKKRVLHAIDKTEKLAEQADNRAEEYREKVEDLKPYRALVWGAVAGVGLIGLGLFLWRRSGG